MKNDLGSSIVFEILLNISLKWILGHSRLHIQQMDKNTNCPNDISTHILRCLNPIRYLSRLNGTVSTKVINGSQQVPAGKWSWKIFLLNGNYNGNYIADQWELYIADDDLITLICVDISMGTIYVYIYIADADLAALARIPDPTWHNQVSDMMTFIPSKTPKGWIFSSNSLGALLFKAPEGFGTISPQMRRNTSKENNTGNLYLASSIENSFWQWFQSPQMYLLKASNPSKE